MAQNWVFLQVPALDCQTLEHRVRREKEAALRNAQQPLEAVSRPPKGQATGSIPVECTTFSTANPLPEWWGIFASGAGAVQ
ncbi:hypothetical protein GCM10022631_41670 [Deinococcus rubellus]